MKLIVFVFCLIVITQFSFGQKKMINPHKLFVSNKHSGVSVKPGNSASTLENFGELLSVDTNYVDQGGIKEIMNDDRFLIYTFKDITFYADKLNRITTYTTRSANIEVSQKGLFTFSPSDSMEKVAKIFPEVIQDAKTIYRGRNSDQEYLGAWIPIGDHGVEWDVKIGLLFDPETKFIVEIYYWINP